MYELTQYYDEAYQIYEIRGSDGESWLKVAPERGGIIIGLGLHGNELLYLNKETFYDANKNVRGGIPILFPISGQLDNGEYKWNGIVYKMKNHGVARTNCWEVIDTKINNEASITLLFKSNEETKKSYPFDFEVKFTYVLSDDSLTIKQQYINNSNVDMPIYAGFHPYFKTSHKNLSYKTDAQTYLDYNDMEIHDIEKGLDLSFKKESLALLDADNKEIGFEIPELKKNILLQYGEKFKYVVLWTEKGQDFVCVEPWMALTNELNRKEEVVMIQPGQALKTFLKISVR